MRLDQRRSRSLGCAIEADAVQRIHQQLRPVPFGFRKLAVRIPQLHMTATGFPRRTRQRRIAMRVTALKSASQLNLQPCLTAGQHSEQKSIAAIVAGAAIDAEMPNLWPMPAQAVQCGTAGTAHQVVTRDVQRRECVALHRTDLFDGIEIAVVRMGRHA